MRFLLFADETTGRPLLERALNLRHEFSRRDSTPLLALAIANGRSELLDELLNAVSAGVEERRARTKQEDTSLQARQSYSISWGPNDVYLHVLLLAKHPKATALYLKILDDTPKTTKSTTGLDFAVYPFTGSDEWVNPTYRGMLQSLFPEHREAFFSCVMVLLRSSSLAEREAGQQALQYALDWDFNFQAKYLARERAARLKTLEPLLQKFGTLTETQMRVLVLKELGINLSNEPQQRLEILLQATSHPDRAVVSNALRLLGILIGEDSPQALEHLPAPVKIRAFKALLADRSLTTESVLQRISFN
jgi:hypothetical protein